MVLKRSLFMLALVLCCISFSAFSCDVPLSTTSTDPPPGVTPSDSSAPSLSVTITINEDQDSTDSMSVISMQFLTLAIEEDNYAIFDDREPITCNGRTFTLGSTPTYSFLVPQGGYMCSYTGNTNDGKDWLSPVTIFNVAPRSELSPEAPTVTGKGYSIAYKPDPSDAACAITGVAMDTNGGNIPGPNSSSDRGTYNGPPTGSLSGTGSILLTRTCHWRYQNAFHQVDLTYKSLASVEVTWTH
jgi:hypothetical protein